MQTSAYYRKLALMSSLLALLIVSLSFLLYNHGPRVRIVDFDSDPKLVSLTKNSTMTIHFDRPLKDGDYTAHIRFNPSLSFTTQTTAQNITVTLLENLKHDTEYMIEVGPDIFDRTDRPMSGTYRKTIQTAQPSYAYLERNYGIDYSDESFLSQDADDHIKIARLGEEPEIVFSNPEITMFAANSDYAIIATKGEERDSLYTVNLKNREVREEQLILGGRLNNLTLSPRGKIALYTVTPDFNYVSAEYYEAFSSRVETINLESGETLSLTDPDGDFIRAHSIRVDTDAQVALIQDQTQTFYAISPFNDYDPVLIGSYTSSFGLSDDSSQILFRDNDSFSLYNIASGDISPFDPGTTGYVQSVASRNKKIYIASTSYSAEGWSQSYIHSLQDWDDEEQKIEWSTRDYPKEALLELAPSYDGILMSVQLNPSQCRLDHASPNTQCQQTHTIIYDSENKKSIADFSGFGLVWLP